MICLYQIFLTKTINPNNIDWGTTAAWIALAVAIISPIITTIITNMHQSKMKRLEILNNRGLEIIERYLSVTTRQINIFGLSDEYDKYYSLIFLYVPNDLYKAIEELDKLIRDCDSKSFPDKDKCLPLLHKISKSLQYFKI